MELTPDQQIKLWFHYEEIAMHFNQLIIQYRLQLMGGTGAIGALGFLLMQSKSLHGPERRFYRMLLSGLILMLVSGAATLDLCYYNDLLIGAVDALLELEAKSPHINMSTHIHERVRDTAGSAIRIWYTSILLPLGLFTVWSIWRYWKLPKTGTK